MTRALGLGVALAIWLTCVGGLAYAATLIGTPGNDVLTGTTGADGLYGEDGDDALQGMAGDDDLDGGMGADDLRGGDGEDAASYGSRGASVSVTLDDKADDGEAGEGDDVHRDVEDIYGGDGDDRLVGDAGANTLDGAAGNDTITGGAGTDGLYGGPGDDAIDAKDGRVDTIDCGPGNDIVDADRVDFVTSCERRGAAVALPSARATGAITNLWTASDTTTVATLVVHDLSPENATVNARCRGGGCPFATRRFAVTNARANLTPAFHGRALKPKATIVITITSPGTLGKYVQFTVRENKIPRYRAACVVAASSAPIRCP